VGSAMGAKTGRFVLRGRLRELRNLRYLLAAAALGGFWLVWGDQRWVAWSPLQTFFAPGKTRAVWITGGLCLLATLILPRFFCLYLCPTGAVLSLFNRGALLRGTRFFRKVDYASCDLGATAARPRDCLRCSRCVVLKARPRPITASRERLALGALLVLAAAIGAGYYSDISCARSITHQAAGPVETGLPQHPPEERTAWPPETAATQTPATLTPTERTSVTPYEPMAPRPSDDAEELARHRKTEARKAEEDAQSRSRAREVDKRAVEDALRSGRLSNREAMHYEAVTPTPTPDAK
jgi:hypothetical protein